jgi:flagella basal body P-ring formation protein FlgA
VIRPLTLALALLASPLAADPSLRDAIIAAAAQAGQDITPHLSANRGFPPCAADIAIAPLDGSWARISLTCPDVPGWQRMIRSDAIHPQETRSQGTAEPPGGTAIVLTESLPRGTILQAHHLAARPVRATGQGDLLVDPTHAVGRALRSNLGAGAPLLGRHLAPDTAVSRDRPVTIALAQAPILIEASGVALEDGQLGQEIRVRNSSSNRILHVTVTGPNKVALLPNMR